MKLSENIRSKVRKSVGELESLLKENPNDQIIKSGLKYKALPLLADLGGSILMNPDGDIFHLGWNDEGPAKPVNPENEITSIVAGVERYSWLSDVLPTRNEKNQDCTVCKGKGKLYPDKIRHVFCGECKGLGWK